LFYLEIKKAIAFGKKEAMWELGRDSQAFAIFLVPHRWCSGISKG